MSYSKLTDARSFDLDAGVLGSCLLPFAERIDRIIV